MASDQPPATIDELLDALPQCDCPTDARDQAAATIRDELAARGVDLTNAAQAHAVLAVCDLVHHVSHNEATSRREELDGDVHQRGHQFVAELVQQIANNLYSFIGMVGTAEGAMTVVHGCQDRAVTVWRDTPGDLPPDPEGDR